MGEKRLDLLLHSLFHFSFSFLHLHVASALALGDEKYAREHQQNGDALADAKDAKT